MSNKQKILLRIIIFIPVCVIILFLLINRDYFFTPTSPLISKEVNLGSGYYKDLKNVYRRDIFKGCTDECISIIRRADVNSFEVLDFGFAKDKNDVFIHGKKLDGVDPDKFTILKKGVAKDDKSLFFYDKKINVEGIDSVDIKTFNMIDDSFATDKNNVYFLKGLRYPGRLKKFEIISNKIEVFKILKAGFVKDDVNVFYFDASNMKLDKINIPGIDAKTFEVMEPPTGVLAKDKNNAYQGIGCNSHSYWQGLMIIKGVNSKNLEYIKCECSSPGIIGYEYLFDEKNMFHKSGSYCQWVKSDSDRDTKYNYLFKESKGRCNCNFSDQLN